MEPTDPRTRRRRPSSGIGFILFFCLLGLLGCIGGILLIRWFNQPGNAARGVAIASSWGEPDQEILDMDDPRGVVLRNTTNGDLTIVGGQIEEIPKWVPIFPGARIEKPFYMNRRATSPDRDSVNDGQFELIVRGASKSAIYEYYKNELARRGFEVEKTPPPYLSASTPGEYSRYLQVRVWLGDVKLEYTEWLAPSP